MSIDRFFTVPVAISNPTGATTTDGEGVPTTVPSTVEALGHVQPYRAAEDDHQLGVELAKRARVLWLPLDTAITHRSAVTLRGDTYDVASDPEDWRVGSANDHLEVVLTRSVAG